MAVFTWKRTRAKSSIIILLFVHQVYGMETRLRFVIVPHISERRYLIHNLRDIARFGQQILFCVSLIVCFSTSFFKRLSLLWFIVSQETIPRYNHPLPTSIQNTTSIRFWQLHRYSLLCCKGKEIFLFVNYLLQKNGLYSAFYITGGRYALIDFDRGQAPLHD